MKKTVAAVLAAGTLGVAQPALAHHVMGGGVPDTLTAGLLSGFGHPIIGIDHLAFVVAVGLAAAFTPRRLLSPLAFVAATVVGCLLFIAGIALPLAETAITAAVVGVILNLAVWFALHVVFRDVGSFESFGLQVAAPRLASVDPAAALLAVAALVAVFRFNIGVIPLLAVAAACGLGLWAAGLVVV